MLRVMSDGCDRLSFDPCLRFQAFDEGESSFYFFEATGLIEMKTARKMSPQMFAMFIFNEMLYQSRKSENYTTSKIFLREVYKPYTVIYKLFSLASQNLRRQNPDFGTTNL